MRTRLRSKSALLFLMLGLLLTVPAVALADNVQTNDVDTGGNATKEVGASGTATVRIIGNNSPSGDVSGCNVSSSNPATVGFTVSAPSKLTIGSARVTACGPSGAKNVGYLVTSNAQVGDVITVTTATSGGVSGSKYSESSFTVTVTAPATPADTTKPVLNLPADITAEAAGSSGAAVSYSANATDNVDGNIAALCSPASGSTFPLGSTTVNCSATDAAGNQATGSFKVTVQDTTGPTITNVPSDIIKEAISSTGATVTYTDPTANDAVDGNRAVTCSPDSGSTFSLGTTDVTCSASDTRGNTTSAKFNVTVEDATGPVLSLPDDKTVEATSAAGAKVDFTASANDAVTGNRTVNCTPDSGSTFPIGTTTVNCSANDGSGNATSGSFRITVADTTKPSLNLPEDKTVEATGPNGATANFTATATDLVDGNVDVSCSPDSGSQFSLGNTTVTCMATDNAGNTASSSFKVTVVDTTAPAIAEHDDITGVEATGPGGARVNYDAPTATDLVDTNVNVGCTPASGALLPLGDTTVTCTATDNAGNTASSSFKVTVVDTTAPRLNLPENKAVEATGPGGAAVTFARTANDIVDGTVTVNCFVGNTAVHSGDTFPLGTTTVDCSAKDAAGNTARDSFTVKVQDTTAPTLHLPANITQEATGPNGNVVTFTATANDVVDSNVTVNCTPASGSTFAITTTTVDCSAKDAAGNTARDSFTVKVQDTLGPTNIQFGGNINDGDSFYFGNVPASPTCTAADSGSGLQSCVVSGYSTAVGTHTLKATATDKTGNTATTQITYTVKAWTFKGFYQPVDMGGVYNTVKGGSTVPIKFELFKGTTELTDTAYINQPLQATKVSCTTGVGTDDIELTATGGTSLRYDATGGQYIYNWKTPTGVNNCYKVTITANDGSAQTAYFKLK